MNVFGKTRARFILEEALHGVDGTRPDPDCFYFFQQVSANSGWVRIFRINAPSLKIGTNSGI